MCVTSGQAELSGTILSASYTVVDRKFVHVNGYQNIAVDMRQETTGGNAMILPIPSAYMMGPENLLDTSECPHVLRDMARASERVTRGGGFRSTSPIVQIFEHDIYTVVLADHPKYVNDALMQVSPNKRPSIAPELMEAYATWYPGWKIMLCCFDNREKARANPLLWWYEPMHPYLLFAPGLDCHTGGVPDLSALVDRDHQLIFGGVGVSVWGDDVSYIHRAPFRRHSKSDAGMEPSLVDLYLPDVVKTRHLSRPGFNADFYMRLPDLLEEKMRVHVIAPVGSTIAREDEDWPLMAPYLFFAR